MIAEPVEMAELELTRRRFTVADYLRMVEAELFVEGERVELIQGDLIEMRPIYITHISTLNRLVWILSNALGKQVILSVQNPVQLSEDNLPQPDVAVFRFQEKFYSEQHAKPEDILLIIEVADTSLRYDRRVKSVLYGSAGIADYWIVNLTGRQIEVYREPRPNGYRTVTTYAPSETLSPLAFPDVALNVNEILG